MKAATRLPAMLVALRFSGKKITLQLNRGDILVIIKGQRTSTDETMRRIEYVFYREKELREAVSAARAIGKSSKSGGKGHAFISDPTAQQGIKRAMPLKSIILPDGAVVYNPEKWIRVINTVYGKLTQGQKDCVALRYRGYSYKQVADKLHVSQATYYRNINLAQNYARMVAIQLGLVNDI